MSRGPAPDDVGGQNYLTECNEIPVTKHRPVAHVDSVPNPGEARVNQAADKYHPFGTEGAPRRSVLQQHVDFFDRNRDGIITMLDTYVGFREIGFNVFYSALAPFIIHPGFSLATNSSGLPVDPFLRIWVDNIHKAKHGSDTGVYDTEGRFIPQKFEEIFTKWDKDGDDKLNFRDLFRMTQDLKCVLDLFGWFAALFEWGTVWLLCADKEGMVTREQIRGIYDGTFFYEMAKKKRP